MSLNVCVSAMRIISTGKLHIIVCSVLQEMHSFELLVERNTFDVFFAQGSSATYRIYDELICCFHNYLMPQRPAAISKALSQKLDEGAEYIRTKYEEAQKLESFEDVLHIIFNVLDEMYAVIIKNEFKKQLNMMRLELQLDMLIKLVDKLKKVLNSYTAEVRISIN